MRWKPLIIVTAGLILPFIAAEHWVREHLFEHVSYSNSYAVDLALKDLKKRDDWRILVLGDSEARWGIDPKAIELGFEEVGLEAPTMNFALDGFSGDWARQVADSTHLLARLPEVRVALVGLQMVEVAETVTPENVCNASSQSGGFQAPLFRSAFGRDWVDASACPRDWKTWFMTEVEDSLAIVRYRGQLRQLLLQQRSGVGVLGRSDNASAHSYNGYQSHKSILGNASYEEDLRRVLAEKAEGSKGYEPLPPGAWTYMTAEGGYLEKLNHYFRDNGVTLVLVSLPTNPSLLDIKQRRADYITNSALLSAFSERTGAVSVNLGIQDQLNEKVDYADHRHLSGRGAAIFSRELARVLAADPRVTAALSH